MLLHSHMIIATTLVGQTFSNLSTSRYAGATVLSMDESLPILLETGGPCEGEAGTTTLLATAEPPGSGTGPARAPSSEQVVCLV